MKLILALAAIGLGALLEAQSDPTSQARELVEKLRSDEVSERDAATQALKKLGVAIRPVLEEAAKDADAEVASRARQILQLLDEKARAAKAPKHPWAGFRPGSYVRMKSVTTLHVAGNQLHTEMELTYTLVDVTADDVGVRTTVMLANVPPQTSDMRIPLKIPEAKAGEAPPSKSGTEEIEVAGRKLKCDWTEIETEAGGIATVTKLYTHNSVPGYTVKLASKSSSMNMVMQVLEYAAK